MSESGPLFTVFVKINHRLQVSRHAFTISASYDHGGTMHQWYIVVLGLVRISCTGLTFHDTERKSDNDDHAWVVRQMMKNLTVCRWCGASQYSSTTVHSDTPAFVYNVATL